MSPQDITINIAGTIDRVLFRSGESGYAAMKLKPDGEAKVPYTLKGADGMVAIVGTLSELGVGQRLSVTGKVIDHRRFGPQIRVESMVMLEPKDISDIVIYLTKNVKSVGPHYAKKIVAAWGMDTFTVLDTNPERLYEIKGIDQVRAEGIRTAWGELKSLRDLLLFATQMGIGHAYIARIHKSYGDSAIELIRADPYRLARDIEGIGFAKADEIAMNMNVPEVSDIRIRAAALYLLEQSAQANGDCYLFRHDLITQTAEFLNNVQINVNMVADVVSKAADLKIVIDDEGRVYPPDLHRAERDAASRLFAILTDQLPPALIGQNLEKAIIKALSSAGLELHPVQIEAIDRTMRNKVSVITGGPGVGKTTITRAIVAGYDAAEVPLTLLAPTGKAAKRMTEVIGRQAHTIHRRLWSLNKDVKEGSVELEDAQLRGVVIVDEVSMVDIKTLAWLLSFVHPSAVLVFVGDADQLPSVGPGSVLRDLLNTPSMAATRLTQIFRQAAASDIVRHAHAINQGMTPPIERLSGEIVRARGWPKTDFFLIEEEDQTKMADKAVWAATHMALRLGFDPLADVQVLTPMKRGDAGVGNLNRVLQGALNPSPGDSIKRFDLATWGVGDRLMQLKNNYDYDIYNGDQGRIVRFTRKQDDSDPTHLVLDVDGREVEIEREDFHQLTLAYAATVHKSQGSEFPFVVICLHTSHFTLLQRNLLYTGVTRGKKCVVLIAHPQALSMAVANNKVSRRNTHLTQRLTPYQKAA